MPPRSQAERGQSLVELAIGFVVVSVLLLAMLDLGRLYFTIVALEDAVGEAALFLSIYPTCVDADDFRPDGVTPCGPLFNAHARAQDAIGGDDDTPGAVKLVDWSKAVIQDSVPKDPITGQSIIGVGEPVTVSITYEYTLLTPLVPSWIGVNPLKLTVSATQRVINEGSE